MIKRGGGVFKVDSGRGFLLPMLGFIIFGGVLLMNIEKGDVILWVNKYHSPFLDYFFKYFTSLGEAGVYLVGLLVFLFIEYRKAWSFISLGVLVSVVSYFSKIYFHHPRPLLYFSRIHLIDTISLVPDVVLHGGNSSFPSGHTLSAFAIYTLFACYAKKMSWQFVFFMMAILVGLSRVYLVQHFFEDVYLGAIMGAFIGWGVYKIHTTLLYS